ncbi:hypothetical protein Tco_0422475 [Tanacetum coccineum]
MATLEFCSKHNMVAYLEKRDGNTEFHQIMDLLICSLIYYALTVCLIVSTSFVEQIWTTAKSRTVNNISYIDATVAGKPVTISEASIRSDLLFDDADGIDSLNNQAIFDNIQLMGPSPSIAVPDSNPEGSGGNHGGQSSNDAFLSGNEDGLTLQSVYDLCVSLCKQVTARAKELKALKAQFKSKRVYKEYVSKQGRKSVKGEPSMHKDPGFDDLDDFVDVDDTLDYMETEDDQNEGRTSSVVLEEKESAYKEVSIEAPKGTDKKNEGTDKKDGGTDNTKVSTDRQGEGTPDQNEGKRATQTAPTTTSTPTPTIFGDDEPFHNLQIKKRSRKLQEAWEAEEEKGKGWMREAQRLHSLLNMISFRQDHNATIYMLKSFKRKKGNKAKLVQNKRFGKDKSNTLIVDSLLKTIRLSIHLVVYNEELAIPEQIATGKGISNPLMAGSLPKTTKPTRLDF